jgi:hypothetical protein
MRPFTLDDLLPLAEFAARRREFFDSLARYLDRYRRVRIGPRLTLVFENRQTLWFRVQELIRVTRLSDPARLGEELAIYNRLLPGPDLLQAALLVEIADQARLTEELMPWSSLRGNYLCLRVADQMIPATLRTCRPEDLHVGAAHWLQFAVNPDQRRLLANFRLPARFEISHLDYNHASPPLADEVRQSLLDDLELSDRDQLVVAK